MSPRINAITLFVIAAAAGGACEANRRRTPDDTIVLVIDGEMKTADPRFALSNYDAKLVRLIAPGLTTVDTPDVAPQPMLAEKIDRVDDVTYDITLRADARFSDGSQVTTEDVVRTYESVMDDNCGSLYQRGFKERYKKLEALDTKHVRFHLVEPLATFMTDIEFGIVSFHGIAAGQCRLPRVIGAGPFMLRELNARHAVLDANKYSIAPPKMKHVEIRVVRDAAARILMLVGGSADVVQNAVRGDLVDDVVKRPRVEVSAGPSVLLTYMLINNLDPILKDVRVRQAIALAIDRTSILSAKFGGRGVLATGIIPPAHWAYNGDVARYDLDLVRAIKLLDDAGLKPDRSGVRLRLVYKTSADAFRVAIARVISGQLRAIGIQVEVRSFEFGTFFADVKKGNYQIATMQSPEITEPDFLLWFFNSTRWPTVKDPDGSNRWRYKNEEVDRLTFAGRKELDVEKRKQLYARVQKIVADELPIIPLWHEHNVVLTNVDLKGYTIVPDARLVGLSTASKSL